jgi:hypothetical protein
MFRKIYKLITVALLIKSASACFFFLYERVNILQDPHAPAREDCRHAVLTATKQKEYLQGGKNTKIDQAVSA